MKLAVVILNWNGEKMLKEYLPSVVEYSREDNVTVYVADNASTDGSLEWIKNNCPSVRLIALSENFGFAGGYNAALKEISSDYYLLLNSDVKVTPNWLQPLIAFMDSHPAVAACQPKLLSMMEPESFEYAGACGGFLDHWGYPFCRGRIFNTVEKDHGQYDVPLHLFWATGAALMIRSDDYWAAGALDERFFAHMEEIDLCWRLRRMNSEIICIPQKSVFHLGGATIKKENPHKTFLNFRNNLLMLYKNLPEDELKAVMNVRSVLDFIAALVFVLKGDVKNAWAVYRAHREYSRMKPSFFFDRKRYPSEIEQKNIRERVCGSILYSYYILRKRTFAELTEKKVVET